MGKSMFRSGGQAPPWAPAPSWSITVLVSHSKPQANHVLVKFHRGWLQTSPTSAKDMKDHLQIGFLAASALKSRRIMGGVGHWPRVWLKSPEQT